MYVSGEWCAGEADAIVNLTQITDVMTKDKELRAWCCKHLQTKGEAAYEIPWAKWTKNFVERLGLFSTSDLIEAFHFQSTVKAWINVLIKQ